MRGVSNALVGLLLVSQALAALRVILRLARTAQGDRILETDEIAGAGAVSVIVPVLNEEHRLGPCLLGLSRQGEAVREILVVDGGSTDGTRALAEAWAARDPRIRFIDASPVPDGWNGKPWGLHTGAMSIDPGSRWLLTIDADVRPEPMLATSLLAHAERHALGALSVATHQRVSGLIEAPIHTSLLATLVYRYGIPGRIFNNPDAVQANGQCFLIERSALDIVGGFLTVAQSLVEDVTLARRCVLAGVRYGFFEPAHDGALVTVEMYADWYDALSNWSRSLPMRDRDSGVSWASRMADQALSMGAPVPVLALAAVWRRMPHRSLAIRLNAGLLSTRIGTQAGMTRAYVALPVTHWIAVLLDPVAVAILMGQACRREHRWRGRVVRW
ncbi:MAG: glycosyltransferase [Chloroflexota bacterium]|nr:glycosyltransferase [Chloroflexota bacterium]